jgi:peptide/nickel transport system permease protein
MIVTLWIISIISFVVIQLPPGDYLTTLAINLEESGYPVEEAMLERYRIRFGLDKTLFEQYFIWITNFVQGDMGYSFGWKANVNTLIWERLLLTIVLSMSSLILTWLISIPIGVYSALKQHSVGDYAFTILGLAGVSVPSFMLALVLMYLAFSKFGVDVGGLFSPQYEGAPWSLGKMLDLLMHIWLPGFIIAITGTAGLIRTLRANLLDELKKPYIITARSKGVAYRKVVMKYPMRIALNPFISSFAYILPALISGSTIISVVLNLPTTGPLLLGALQTQDMYLAGSFIMLLSVLTVIGTFFSDLLLAAIDPRVRFF